MSVWLSTSEGRQGGKASEGPPQAAEAVKAAWWVDHNKQPLFLSLSVSSAAGFPPLCSLFRTFLRACPIYKEEEKIISADSPLGGGGGDDSAVQIIMPMELNHVRDHKCYTLRMAAKELIIKSGIVKFNNPHG